MATAGKVRSNKIGVFISNQAPGGAGDGTVISGATFGDNTDSSFEDDTFELIACATSGSFSAQTDVIEATTKDNDGQREILIGGTTWSMSAEGLIQYDLATDVRSSIDLFDLWSGKTKVRIAWTTGADGDYMYFGNAYVTSIEETAGLNEVATFSVSFEGDGSITKAVVDTGHAASFTNNDD